jgi:limonene-1,2-epoxide hydrolase
MTDTDIEQRNARTTREFLAAWSQLSTAALLPYFAEGAVYQNMPWPPLAGTTAIRGFLDAFFPMADRLQFDTSLLTTKGSLVYTERVDQFWLKGGPHISLPILGVFEFDSAGKIKAWRDYFDLKTWLDQGGPPL